MYKRVFYLLYFSFLVSDAIYAQSTYLPLNTGDYQLLDRLETKSGRLSDSLFLTDKPVLRSDATYFLQQQNQQPAFISDLSKRDVYDIKRMISENGEWTPDGNGAIDSRHPWFNTFYLKQPDFAYVKTKDFFLVVNPMLDLTSFYEKSSISSGYKGSNPLLANSHGAEARGWISKRIGFYTYFTDNQDKLPSNINEWSVLHNAMPGVDWYTQNSSKTFDYLQYGGYIEFEAIKNHLNITFGQDKNFIGDGIYSLFLSDFSAPTAFLRLNARIGRFNYEDMYLEGTPNFDFSLHDVILTRKYATIHHLSFNAAKWLNLGLFESNLFDGVNNFRIEYLNPVILTGVIQNNIDNANSENLGLNFKAIAARHLQFYGQMFMSAYKPGQFFTGLGWKDNKWGIQLGGKYFDAFTLKNLDLQGELNYVRPFTYSAVDTIVNYSNFNQPLANPLGSDFVQAIGIARYHPVQNLFFNIKLMYYKKGVDTGKANYGDNIVKAYTIYKSNGMINGPTVSCVIADVSASYQLAQNLFIDLGFISRRFTNDDIKKPVALYESISGTYLYGGLRLNIAKRDYSFY